MKSVLLLAVLAQAVVVAPPAVAPAPLQWTDGRRTFTVVESTTLVAEPSPSDASKQALLALDPAARVVTDTATMRLWQVTDAATLRAKLPALRAAVRDGRFGSGRVRVPLALVCDGQRKELGWREVLAGTSARCLPDFWYPPVKK